jgi:hypothetical protein
MDMIANPLLLTIGLFFLVCGYLLLRRAKGQSLVDATTDATWEFIKKRDMGALRQHLEGTLSDITLEQSNTARAKKLAGMAAREAMSRVLRVAGIISVLGGLVLAALGSFWT